VGFEPTLEFPLNTLSKRAPSTTRPSLHGVVVLVESNIGGGAVCGPTITFTDCLQMPLEIVYFPPWLVYSGALFPQINAAGGHGTVT
jgi:hypothetical protein